MQPRNHTHSHSPTYTHYHYHYHSKWPTIPQLYVEGEFVGGCDIVIGMHNDGELAEVLQSVIDRPVSREE
jgi:glutaredoxin